VVASARSELLLRPEDDSAMSALEGSFTRHDGSVTLWFGDGKPRHLLRCKPCAGAGTVLVEPEPNTKGEGKLYPCEACQGSGWARR
jgi:hypothetical protein